MNKKIGFGLTANDMGFDFTACDTPLNPPQNRIYISELFQ